MATFDPLTCTEVDRESECCVCLETYSIRHKRMPHILSCGHSLCSSCIGALVRLAPHRPLLCPMCRRCHLAHLIPVNKQLLQRATQMFLPKAFLDALDSYILSPSGLSKPSCNT
ncbi:hypothetical protein Pcinc_025944 [Petrolisthes cinctipes]|uniref:RING-type domain-containing protein n=1 Tax=Petrolisthes cinctipes TaxID=88211 RepID=A0AAE1KCB5_PETCI|nr:hypothetical protein Pcinc_025944 [Petrolisthes cinctipes]